MIDIKKFIYPIIIVILLFIIFIQRSCSNKDLPSVQNQEVIVPAQHGSFNAVKPVKVHDTIIKDSIVFKDKKITIVNPLDKQLVIDYLKAKDSIQKLHLFMNAVKINKYKQNFDNKDINLTIEAETTGTLNYIKPTYIIKERIVDVPVKAKQTVFALYTGVEVYNNTTLTNSGIKIDLGIQNKKGDIYTAGFDTNNNIFIGYKLRLINIKK
jgi:hypothetical protein